jgi:opacity protein-like surface antigen
MLNRKTLVGLLLSVTPLVNTAVRAEPPAPESLQFEVTPFLGYRVGGNFHLVDNDQTMNVADHSSLALAFDVRGADWTQYELFYGRQSTALSTVAFVPSGVRVEYLHIGGTVALDGTPRLNPYFAGGLGITRLTPDSALGNDDTRFSISLALGLRVPVSQHFSLRFEGRGFFTPINTDSAVFCHSDQSGALCEVHAQGYSFLQFDFLAGVAYTF